MSSLDPSVFVVLSATASRLRGLVAELPEATLLLPLDEGWSVKHALAHLLDTEEVIAGRIRRIVEEDHPFIRSIDPTARLRDDGYLDRPAESLLVGIEVTRSTGLAWLRTLSADDLERFGTHDEAGEISAANHAQQWAYHDLMHLKQIESMLQTHLEAGMGNTLKFYFDV